MTAMRTFLLNIKAVRHYHYDCELLTVILILGCFLKTLMMIFIPNSKAFTKPCYDCELLTVILIIGWGYHDNNEDIAI
jgi:hypothetical protein